MSRRRPEFTRERFERMQAGALPGTLGMRVDAIDDGTLAMSMDVLPLHLAPNGFLHAGSVVALADTAAGYGCVSHLPEGAAGFTTIELKSNFVGTSLEGRIVATATLHHGGRTTQVWDAIVKTTDDRLLAMFRCTQMILWPKT